jgi:hypothetical protein
MVVTPEAVEDARQGAAAAGLDPALDRDQACFGASRPVLNVSR